MLEIGSEIDVVFKEYCKTIDSSFSNAYKTIGRYKESIHRNNIDFFTSEVSILNSNDKLYPWNDWNTLDAPIWWTAYNKIKHNRTSVVEINGVNASIDLS